ncbi:hypothetical protein, partial [Jiella sp. M17.18]|uniref:hypothetical protein n=1 Tax=Jiella sp. M17.18 TaxID=3234247 RepID=UPI0034DF66F6
MDYEDAAINMSEAGTAPGAAAQAGDAPAPLARVKETMVTEEVRTQAAATTGSRAARELKARKKKKASAKAGSQTKKGKGRRKRKEPSVPFDLEALPPEALEIAHTSIATVHEIGRKTTDNLFELGAAFEAMASVIPDPKHWKAAVKTHCGVTARSANNWRRVVRVLGHRREVLVRHQVTPT